jgi:hypothetical protein
MAGILILAALVVGVTICVAIGYIVFLQPNPDSNVPDLPSSDAAVEPPSDETSSSGEPPLKGTRAERLDSAIRPKEEKMKILPQVLFWLGLISIPFAWLVWYFGPQVEVLRPIFASISDPALRAALQEAHAERLGIWVSVWPVTLLILSQILQKKMQG